jgi:hypothetical protein
MKHRRSAPLATIVQAPTSKPQAVQPRARALAAVPDRPPPRRPPRAPGALLPNVVVATLADFSDQGEPLVTGIARVPRSRPVIARSIVVLAASDIGAQVVLAFEGGKRRKPVIMGKLQVPQRSARQLEPTLDGQHLVFTAEQEITLRCGASSITLTRAGKILIRGEYLSSRAAGVNRIQGGSVQIN